MDRMICVIDVVWVHPACQTQRKAAARCTGAAAQDVENRKRTKYRNGIGLNSYKLLPFAIETHDPPAARRCSC